ncbi:MAG: hypothetical protein OXG94_04280 [Bacteroidetes bacterium]|nr:hypothetical protein [Bacteroidota bacterium]
MRIQISPLDKLPYVLLGILTVLFIPLLVKLSQPQAISDELRLEIFSYRVEAMATATEEIALELPIDVFGSPAKPHNAEVSVSIVILLDTNNCSNGLVSDIAKLNEFHRTPREWINSVQGYYVSPDKKYLEEFILMHAIEFPVVHMNPLEEFPDYYTISTPLVLVLDSKSHTILDTHQPIPDDVLKSRLFYDKWDRIMTGLASSL